MPFPKTSFWFTIARFLFVAAIFMTTAVKAEPLTRGLAATPASIHPFHFGGLPGAQVIKDIYEGLVVQNKNGDPIPALARKIHISEDKMTYTFTLWDDLKWSDGSELTAKDVENSFKALASKDSMNHYRWYLKVANITGAQEALNGKPDSLGVNAQNNQLTIRLSQPTPYLLSLLTFPSFLPVHQTNLSNTDSSVLITNGPYKLKQASSSGYHLVANPHHRKAEKVDIPEVHYRIIPEHLQEIAQFEQRRLDITSHLPSTLANDLRKKHPVSVFEHAYLATQFFLVNPASSKLKDRRIREALSLAINRQALINVPFKNTKTTAACSFTPPTAHGYSPDPANCKKLLHNPQRSAQALELFNIANKKNKGGSLTLSLLTTPKYLNLSVLPIICQQIEDTLGVKINIKTLVWSDFISTLSKGEFDLVWLGWLGAYNDATAFLLPLIEARMFGPYKNDIYTQQLKLAFEQSTFVKRLPFYQQAEKQLALDLPVIPVLHPSITTLVSPQIGGYYSSNPEGWIQSKYLYRITDF